MRNCLGRTKPSIVNQTLVKAARISREGKSSNIFKLYIWIVRMFFLAQRNNFEIIKKKSNGNMNDSSLLSVKDKLCVCYLRWTTGKMLMEKKILINYFFFPKKRPCVCSVTLMEHLWCWVWFSHWEEKGKVLTESPRCDFLTYALVQTLSSSSANCQSHK